MLENVEYRVFTVSCLAYIATWVTYVMIKKVDCFECIDKIASFGK